MKRNLMCVLAAASALAASGASAAVVVNVPNPNPYIAGLDDVHSSGTQSGDGEVFGDLDTGVKAVTFTSSQNLNTNGNGVAQIDGPWNNLSFFLTSGGTFEQANFAVSAAGINGNNGVPAYLDIFATVFGTGEVLALNNFELKNGENKFSLEGTAGETFSLVRFAVYSNTANTLTRNVDSLRQVELGGIAAVPEPATWAMMLMGFFGLGSMLRSRRQHSALAA